MESTEQPETAPVAEVLTFRAVPWRLRHVVIGFAPVVSAVVLALSPVARAVPLPVALSVILCAEVWLIAYPVGLARRHGWRPQFSVNPPRVVFELLLSAMVVGALWAALVLGYAAWVAAFGDPPPAADPVGRAARSANPLVLVLVVTMALVVAPVAEEVFFRGMVYRALRRSTARSLAVLVQAAAFGILHAGYGATHVVVAAVGGVVLALVYDVRKTLVTPILCHGMYNATVLAVAVAAGIQASDAPALGVHGTPHESGMLVTDVAPGGGAEAAGIRAGDVLYTVDGWGVQNAEHVSNTLHDKKPGESVPVEYIRDGVLHRVEVALRSRRELRRQPGPARDRP